MTWKPWEPFIAEARKIPKCNNAFFKQLISTNLKPLQGFSEFFNHIALIYQKYQVLIANCQLPIPTTTN
jgi:hypothetical protein